MNNSIVLAQVLGIIFIVVGISILLNKKGMMKIMEELNQNKVFMFLVGVVALVVGAVLVTLNNLWTSGLPLIVTIIGWLALLKGAFLLIIPDTAASFYKKVNKGNILISAGLVVLVVGLILLL